MGGKQQQENIAPACEQEIAHMTISWGFEATLAHQSGSLGVDHS